MAVFLAALAAMSAKDPAVVVARQRFVWKQERPESKAAARWLAGYVVLLAFWAAVLAQSWEPRYLIGAAVAAMLFGAVAVLVNVRNKQRSVLFQVLSAAMLTSGSLAVALTATSAIEPWALWLWALCALQATAGILVVHARLDARIKLRNPAAPAEESRRSAAVAIAVLFCAAIAAGFFGRWWIAAALLLIAAGYTHELREQRDPAALQLPLKKVGLRALALSVAYTVLLVAGLWDLSGVG